ncbi:site-specific integrase [Vicingaceae bacterium]|nr:site-specific integrase [Vicingaceae bacterium]
MKKVKVSLFVKSDKTNEKGQLAVYYKIQSGFSKTTFSAGVYVTHDRWKITDQFRQTRDLPEKKIRNVFDCAIADLQEIHSNLELKNLPFSAKTVKEIFLKGGLEDMGDEVLLSDLFTQHYKVFVPLVETGNRAKQTLGKYRTVEKHLKEFMKLNYHIEDIALKSLNFEFVDSFDAFLRTVKGISNNPTVKYIQTFRSLINLAVKYDWLVKDPFLLYDKKVRKKDAVYLTSDELDRIENVKLSSERLQIVRDIFILNCYVGYAPVDLFNLKYENIVKGNDGQKWIVMDRQKTGVNSDVPLLPKAEKIINKYKDELYKLMSF